MKRLVWIAVGSWLLSACMGVSEEVVLPTAETVVVETAVAEIVPTAEVVAVVTAVATITPLPNPTASPVVSAAPAQFTNLHFVTARNGLPQAVFAPGTEEVYAVWDYVNLLGTDVLRREWTKDGAAWLEREESWDVDSFGSAGTRGDVSIYDFEGSGLEPASYRLTLYLNGVYQTEAAFEIRPTLATSTETQVAWVQENNILMLDAWDGSQRELARANRIVELLWLPDARHLLYVDEQQETGPNAPPWPRHELWAVDTETSEQWQLGTLAEDLHRIGFMPGARFIYTMPGSDFGDACFMDRRLAFVELDERYQRLNLHDMHDFAGIPSAQSHWFFPDEAGKWVSDHEYDVHINAFCLSAEMGASEEDLALIGRYRLNLETLTAVQLSNP